MNVLKFYDDGHRYELNGVEVPSVSELIRFLSRDIYGDIDHYILDAAAERGTEVHQATEQLDRTGECEIDSQYSGYLKGYVQFLREHHVKWDLIEAPLADPVNQYAGTIDRRGLVDGKYSTLDIKTNGVIKKTLVKAQLNGYEGLCTANGLMPSDELFCLQLIQNGKYRLYKVAKDATEFNACLALHKALRRKHGRMRIE